MFRRHEETRYEDTNECVMTTLLGGQGRRHRGGVAGRGQLLVLHCLDPELVLVDVDDVLVGGVGLGEGVQLVHLPDVGPQVDQASRDLKLAEERS